MDLALAFNDSPDSSKRRRFALLTWLRFGLSILLTLSLALLFGGGDKASNALSPTFIAGTYVLASFVGLWMLLYSVIPWSIQLLGQLLVEVILIALMVASLGGGAGGYAILYMVPIAGAASLMSWSAAMFICSVSVISLFIDGLRRASLGNAQVDWVLLGVFGIAGFALMALLRLAAQRTETIETLARQAHTQARLAQELSEQHIVEETLGWLVLDELHTVRLLNAPVRSLAWQAQEILELGAVIQANSPLHVWLGALTLAGEHLVPWPPAQVVGASRDQLFIKASRLPHLPGYTALTMELGSARNAKARDLNLATMGRLSASIAHEIRNPLAAISQAAELLQESSSLPASDAPLLAMLLSNTRRIDRIVHHLLAWSRGVHANAQVFEPRAMVLELLAQIELGLKLKPNQLLIDSQADSDEGSLPAVRFDPDHLYQIMSNLLSNATRYASGAPASLRLSLKARGQFVALLLLDDGPPVDGVVAQHLFEPFQSGSNQSTGLGLFLCREYAQANHGSLQLMSGPADAWVSAPYTKAFVLNLPVEALGKSA